MVCLYVVSSPALLRHHTSSADDIARLRHGVADSRGVGVHEMSTGRPLLTRSRSDVTSDSVRMSALRDNVTVDTHQLSADALESHYPVSLSPCVLSCMFCDMFELVT